MVAAEAVDPYWIDRQNPIHVFDSHNLPIVLRELGTVSDFAGYLDEKLRARARFQHTWPY
ncbi:MAG: hypothetical protein V4684_02250 [Pseudomonadota bacterium]